MEQDDFTYRSQSVSYLGFLEAQLRDLQGIDTLAFELIQNADDSLGDHDHPQASHITFDVTDEALLVQNDSVFRARDFARLQEIAGGSKRTETGTTGAFGIGFVAVYQVTDEPEILSGGKQWRIKPTAPADQRIQEREVATEGTTFRLPWAADGRSSLRQALRLAPIRLDELDDLALSLAHASRLAAIFLRRLHLLEVKRNGRLLSRIERQLTDDEVNLVDEQGRHQRWFIRSADFDEAATDLRTQHPGQIEDGRRATVHLAIASAADTGRGRLFAILPTATATPMPLHINADFFPTTDRKRIHFHDGYQADWNRAAITLAARLLAANLSELRRLLGPIAFWQLLAKMAETAQLAEQSDLPAVFQHFWLEAAPLFPEMPIIYTADNDWLPPTAVRLLDRSTPATARQLLAALAIPTVNPDLAPQRTLMRRPEINVRPVRVSDLTHAISRSDLRSGTSLHQAPAALRSFAAWRTLWQLLDDSLGRLTAPERSAALDDVSRVPLILTQMMQLQPLNRVFRGRPEAQALFPEVDWVHAEIAEYGFPGQYVANFGVRQAVSRLAELPIDQLEASWKMGRLDIPRLFRWFEAQSIEIFADDPALAREILRLPLCPVAGELRPLADLFIPGNFSDPLRLSGLVDIEAVGGRRQFLEDLGLRQLDFDTYVHEQLPRVLGQNPDLPSDARHDLLQLLATRLGQLQDDAFLQEELGLLPLIPCLDGAFRPAPGVYASRNLRQLLGDNIHIAEPPQSPSIDALYRWLGVRERAATGDLVGAILSLSQAQTSPSKPLPEATMSTVMRAWLALNERLTQAEVTSEQTAALAAQPTIPNLERRLTRPNHLFFADQPGLVAQFPSLSANMLPTNDLVSIYAAVGVRRLSQAASLQVLAAETAHPAPALQARIEQRRPLLQRVLAAEIPQAAERAEPFWQGLTVYAHPDLQIAYHLAWGDARVAAPATAVPVKLVDDKLYVTGEVAEVGWTAVARELALALKPAGPVGGLAGGFKAVLAAESEAAAAALLDELGYL